MAKTVLVVAGLAGCGGAPSGEPGTTPAATAPATGADDGSATAAFRQHVAKLLQVPASEVHGGPADNSLGNHTRGAARHYAMWPGQDTNNSIRGWATPDGTVITPEQNLGVLLVEAGVWARPPKQPLDELAQVLADDIIWAYGSQGMFVTTAPLVEGVTAPEIKLRPDGSGTFRFFCNDHGGASILGGGGAPADVYWENIVVLTADHKATLSKQELGARK